eukprot:14282858-Alexandrium_andersonii.AAC.1
MSDVGGVGTSDGAISRDGMLSDGAQGAYVVLGMQGGFQPGQRSLATLLAWRSAKLKRRVPSTLAGEALALSLAVALTEHLQILWRDVNFQDAD